MTAGKGHIMKVKATDIARELGISKSTVSLALNNKPSVNEQTRRRIFDCRDRLAQGLPGDGMQMNPTDAAHKEVKILRFSNGMKQVIGAEMDLWTDVNAVFEKCLFQKNYSMGVMYPDLRSPDYTRIYDACSRDDVAGVIIFGTELLQSDLEKIRGIRKPMVIYDCLLPGANCPAVLLNNRQGVTLAVDELTANGHQDILFLNNPMPMYNYESRTEAFIDAMSAHGAADAAERVVMTESSVQGVYEVMRSYLKSHRLPQAFLTGSYHVSIGLMRALDEAAVRIPEDVSIIGIDEIPDYMTNGKKLTAVHVPHTERAFWTIQMLFHEMENPPQEKSILYTDCILMPGETVRRV